MKKFLFLLSMCVAAGAFASPSRNQYSACKQGANNYAPVAVGFSNIVTEMLRTTNPKTKARNQWIEAIGQIKDEQEAKESEKLRQVEARLVREGEDYLSAGEWRLFMEAAWLMAFNLGTSVPGKSELYYKNAIEDRCLRGS